MRVRRRLGVGRRGLDAEIGTMHGGADLVRHGGGTWSNRASGRRRAEQRDAEERGESDTRMLAIEEDSREKRKNEARTGGGIGGQLPLGDSVLGYKIPIEFFLCLPSCRRKPEEHKRNSLTPLTRAVPSLGPTHAHWGLWAEQNIEAQTQLMEEESCSCRWW